MSPIVLLLTLVLSCEANLMDGSRLHNFMDDEEINYFFGSDAELPEYEIVDLPENLSDGRESVVNDDDSESNDGKFMKFKVFDKQIELHLHPNKNIISTDTRILKTTKSSSKLVRRNESNCHFLHVDNTSTAAISNCEPREIRGLIFLANDTLEIVPLTARLKMLLMLRTVTTEITKEGFVITKVPHLVKRSQLLTESFEHDELLPNYREKKFQSQNDLRRIIIDELDRPTVELGLFFDESFYNYFAPFFDHDDNQLTDFILSYINNVQSLYHHHSLGRKIDFTIAYIEIMQEQSEDMPHAYGERNALIDNFCDYQKMKNTGNDWDMADFFAWESNGQKNSVTMGLATVGGVCNNDYNCIIVEFGTVNRFGKPYPSTGYTATYILAHEIGHNLGMPHDATGNSCHKDGFIMSPSRGTNGETTWSSCSAKVVKNLAWAKCLFTKSSKQQSDLDPWKFGGYPGVTYTAKVQCEILLRDKEAFEFNDSDICENLHCRTPNRPGFSFAGPALQGTTCGNEKWCEGGRCVYKKKLSASTTSKPLLQWSPWDIMTCKSECLNLSRGYQARRRICISPRGVCEGSSQTVNLCDDRKICFGRKPVMTYGTEMCRKFSEDIPSIDPAGVGLQANYEHLRLWMPCAIFCKRKNTSSYFTPRVELNDLGINPYYPDGTFCHREGTENFYCIQHHCLPESTTLTKSPILPTENFEVLGSTFATS